jgi:hypothetical protein
MSCVNLQIFEVAAKWMPTCSVPGVAEVAAGAAPGRAPCAAEAGPPLAIPEADDSLATGLWAVGFAAAAAGAMFGSAGAWFEFLKLNNFFIE